MKRESITIARDEEEDVVVREIESGVWLVESSERESLGILSKRERARVKVVEEREGQS